jgi:hypothetical protein
VNDPKTKAQLEAAQAFIDEKSDYAVTVGVESLKDANDKNIKAPYLTIYKKDASGIYSEIGTAHIDVSKPGKRPEPVFATNDGFAFIGLPMAAQYFSIYKIKIDSHQDYRTASIESSRVVKLEEKITSPEEKPAPNSSPAARSPAASIEKKPAAVPPPEPLTNAMIAQKLLQTAPGPEDKSMGPEMMEARTKIAAMQNCMRKMKLYDADGSKAATDGQWNMEAEEAYIRLVERALTVAREDKQEAPLAAVLTQEMPEDDRKQLNDLVNKDALFYAITQGADKFFGRDAAVSRLTGGSAIVGFSGPLIDEMREQIRQNPQPPEDEFALAGTAAGQQSPAGSFPVNPLPKNKM